MTMRENIERLKNSPIYAMSLGSKELFHSNFWAWLMKKDLGFIEVFFEERIDNPEVKREEENRDLTIWENRWDQKAYVIENKIKAIPTREQLVKYQESLKEKFVKGILTGLRKPMEGILPDGPFSPIERLQRDCGRGLLCWTICLVRSWRNTVI